MSVNILTSIVALAVFSSGITGMKNAFAPLFIVMALIYGLLTLGSQSLYITAVKSGSVSVCSLIYASCFVIPTVYSVIRNGETISPSKLFGIILMLFSVVLVSLKNKSEKGSSYKSIKYAVLAMCSAGGVGILQKEFGNIYPQDLLNTFLLLAFFFMLISTVIFKLALSPKNEKQPVTYNRLFFVPAILQ